MKITVVGCGYVGLVTAAGLANFGHLVTGVDRNRNKIDKLRHKELPFYEKGLIELVRKNLEARRLYFTTSLGLAIANSQVIFIAVGTPTRPDGSADLEQVEAVAKEIAAYLRDYTVIVNKSTVPVGTGERVKKLISRHSRLSSTFDVVSNPEFLKEGSAVADFTFPDRIIIGADSTKALKIMEQLYAPFIENNIPLIRTNL
ncbi:MAG TPA: UDP-glucose 6-dehydrogenase, partial [Firmicutes bacterium]|nr:UDP-glucose 6-dehydrogenase [Bacillota bacterium]